MNTNTFNKNFSLLYGIYHFFHILFSFGFIRKYFIAFWITLL